MTQTPSQAEEGTSESSSNQLQDLSLAGRREAQKSNEAEDYSTWLKIRKDGSCKLDPEKWDKGPYLTRKDLVPIEGYPRGIGCCECCHKLPKCPDYCCFPSIKFPLSIQP